MGAVKFLLRRGEVVRGGVVGAVSAPPLEEIFVTGQMIANLAGCSLVQWFINMVMYFLLREDPFPLYLTLSPIGGEGKRWDQFEALTS